MITIKRCVGRLKVLGVGILIFERRSQSHKLLLRFCHIHCLAFVASGIVGELKLGGCICQQLGVRYIFTVHVQAP